MNWFLAAGTAVSIGAWLILKRLSFVSPALARQHLAADALVIDVRSPAEFAAGHLRGAVNLPLDRLAGELPQRVPDKDRVLLLHCLSGGRSGLAQLQARRLGYPNALNLGSLARARRIIGVEV
ncbi:MAG: rhodanese-like domain-containing protein [Verrucomicrobia bacterium]|nr:rhodanese-like domain-containing protein [Verrucomicrobiota bacterium]